MISYFRKQLFASLAKRAQEMDLRPVATSSRRHGTKRDPVSGLSSKNSLRVKRYRSKKQKDEVLKRLARDILSRKRQKRHLEDSIASMNQKLDKYALTLDDFIAPADSPGTSTASAVLPSRKRGGPESSSQDLGSQQRSSQTSSSSSGARRSRDSVDELDIVKSRLAYLERKLELIRKSKGVDNQHYTQLKTTIDRLNEMVASKETAS